MARISTYINDKTISGEDLLTGSDYKGINNYETKTFKIKDLTEYIQGQISISPQNTTLKANGGIVVEVINSTDSLAVDLSATNITGQLANSDLANSSITINGTEVSLGGSITIGEVTEVIAGTYLNGGGTEGSVTVNHDATTRTDTTSTASPSYGDNFTVIDTLTTNATGHVTAANVKTITLPASDDTTYTVEAVASSSDSIIRLVGSDSTTDDVKLIAGSNITLSTSETNDTITINSQAFGTVYTVANETAHLALTTSSGDLVIRTDESKTYIDNGTGDSPNVMTNYTELQFSGINNISLTAGNGITLSRTSITNTDNDLTITNALATSTTQGGIELFSDTEQSVVANNVTTENGRTYGIQLNSDNQAVVNVPWSDTNTQNTYAVSIPESTTKLRLSGTISGATDTTDDIEFVGGGTTTVTRTDENTFTISSTDENTEYSAGSGLDLTGTTFSHTDTSSAADLAATARTYVSGLTFDTYGHVTAYTTATETVTDTTRTDEDIRDVTVAMLTAGTNITLTEDDTANTLTIDATDTNTFRTIKVDTNNDGTANETIGASEELKLIGGTNVTLAESAGTVTIAATDTNTTNWNFKIDTGTATNIAAGNTVTFTSGTNVTLSQNGNTIDISSTDTNTDTNYYLDGITKSGNTLTFSVNGATNQTYTFGSNAFNSTAYLTAEADTLATVTGRGASSATASTFSGGLTSSGLFTSSGTGANAYSYFTGNAATTSPAATFTHGLALAWNNSGGSREFEHWWATGSDIGNNTAGKTANRTSYMSWFNRYAPSGGTTVDTRMAKWYGSGEFELMDMAGLPGGGGAPTFSSPYIRLPLVAGNSGQVLSRKSGSTRDTEWTTPFSGDYDDLTNKPTIPTNNNQLINGAGYITSYTETDTLANVTGRGATTATACSFTNTTSFLIGGSGSANLYLGNIINASSTDKGARFHSNNNDFYFDFQGDTTQNWFLRDYDGSGGTHTRFAFDFINAKFTAAGDIVAFGSPSDISLKENIKPIENALDKVEKLQGVTFDWKESDSILDIKQDIGFIAQDVQKVLPELVRENDNGKLSLRHQGIISVLTEAIKELSDRVKALEDGSTN